MKKYKIIRFYKDDRPSRATGIQYQTLEEAQAHCKNEKTHKVIYKNGEKIVEWFDSYAKI